MPAPGIPPLTPEDDVTVQQQQQHVDSHIPNASLPQTRDSHAASSPLRYFVLFLSHWFGANSIDVDGDGDAEDLELAAGSQPDDNTGKLHDTLDCVGDGSADLANGIAINDQGREANAHEIQAIPTTDWVFPYFIVFQAVVTFALWFGYAHAKAAKENSDWRYVQAGLDSMFEGTFTLTLSKGDCDDLRPQIWRWITYQFTHVDLSHVGTNSLMNIMLGVPLEFHHRWWRMAIIFNVGIVGGALGYFVGDSHTVVVGSSAGVYALIGVHTADLLLNWKQRRFRIVTLFLLASMIGADMIVNLTSEASGNIWVHLGGAIAGVCIGVLVCKTINRGAHDRIIIKVFMILGALLTTMCISWMAAQTNGPRNIFEAANGQSGWCWYRQVWDNQVNPEAYECIRCGTKECINQVLNFSKVLPVSLKECDDKGRWHDF